LVHSIKSAAGNVGALALSRIAADAEAGVATADVAVLDGQLRILGEEFQRARAALEAAEV
jgi:HPt (histidine-containing phosphotransfer) domain-containing protein